MKNINWLNNEVEKRIKKIKTDEVSFAGSDFFDEGYIHGMRDVQAIANQLDEPEVLSQELPVIPKFVAEWIEKYVEYGYDLYPALKKMENNARSWERIYDWYRNNTLEFVLAYLTQEYEIEVEEEQRHLLKHDGKYLKSVKVQTYHNRESLDELGIHLSYTVKEYAQIFTKEQKEHIEKHLNVEVEELEE